MQRLATALTREEVIAIVGDYLQDWHPDRTNPLHQGQTEQFIIAKALERLAQLEAAALANPGAPSDSGGDDVK